jgi:hypothetical protein
VLDEVRDEKVLATGSADFGRRSERRRFYAFSARRPQDGSAAGGRSGTEC